MRCSRFLAILFLLHPLANAEVNASRVIGVADGDTITVLDHTRT